MRVFVVYNFIHVQTPYRYIPKLFITEVPVVPNVDWDLVDEYANFGEFNIPHANHYIEELTADSPVAIKRAWRAGEVERVSYSHLCSLRETI